ncbi:uncharacterized protein N7498_010907 [Penicillium cinerascens]|uniref:Serine/threonine-protein phosphatase n=1 Tax=Penicillium cinerascens TaxID=70096 RepID=A0A9W9J9B1_9EURO|nr:uncharacterized protein N7498_010907 [Penicillium cinerascens]KAJ5191922.1 hypothetical protein N7498_010907 [Penicillium cinerascens]
MSTANIKVPLRTTNQIPASPLKPEESECYPGNGPGESANYSNERGIQFPPKEVSAQDSDDLQQLEDTGFGNTADQSTGAGHGHIINSPRRNIFLKFLKKGFPHQGNSSTHGTPDSAVQVIKSTSPKARQPKEDLDPRSKLLLSEKPSSEIPKATSESILRRQNEFNLETIIWDDSSRGRSNMERSTLIDLDGMISRLLQVEKSRVDKKLCLKTDEILSICSAARNTFLSQPALLELNAPIQIVGDIHGQYLDLLRLFEMSGFPPASNYLFLGDYVDRGKQSLETMLLLLCYKLKYPENFFLLRGNHECANVSRIYGFHDECKRRCSVKIWKTFTDVFNCLPIAAVVAEKIFCVHGGLSPNLVDMDEIRNIARPTEVPDQGLLNDLLWSDPANIKDWAPNDDRGVSWFFGRKPLTNFLKRHDLDLVCRSHMVVEGGYQFFGERDLVTVFSAPNVSIQIRYWLAAGIGPDSIFRSKYCGKFDNWGASMEVSADLRCNFNVLKPCDGIALNKRTVRMGRSRKWGKPL